MLISGCNGFLYITGKLQPRRLTTLLCTMMFVFCILLSSSDAQAEQPALTIIKDGQARAQIVLSDSPSRKTRVAADELQKFFKLISGAELPIVITPDTNTPITIYVGQSAAASKLNLPAKTYKHGAYHIASGDNWIALVGDEKDYEPIEPYGKFRSRGEAERVNTEWDKITGEQFTNPFYNLYQFYWSKPGVWRFDGGGVLNAAYHLLREQGCRWYMAGDIGQCIPQAATIELPRINRDFEPVYQLRNLSFYHDHLGVSEDEAMWRLRLGDQGAADTIGIMQPAHGSKFVTMRQEMRDAYPDMFANLNGIAQKDTRGTGVPLLSSQTYFDKHVKFIREYVKHYDQKALNIDMPDGYAFIPDQDRDQATPARGWNGTLSDYVWGYYNRVAEEIYKTNPDVMLYGLAYSAYTLPPEKIDQLSPNLGIIFCQSRRSFHSEAERESIKKLRESWLAKLSSKKFYIFEYYTNNKPQSPYAYIPDYGLELIDKDFRSLQGVSLGESVEIYDHPYPDQFEWDAQAVNHLNIYVTCRLYWDSNADVPQMLEEYYSRFYGPAHKEMKAYIEYGQAHWRSMIKNITELDKSIELLDAAVKAAGDNNIYRDRINLLVAYTKSMEQLRTSMSKGYEDSMVIRSIARNPKEFKLDGKLDEPVWQTVRRYTMQELQTGRSVKNATTVHVAWVGDSLYLGIRCQEPDTAKFERQSLGKDNPSIYNHDNIDILLTTQVHDYYQFTFTALGELLDMDRARGLRTDWSSNATLATHIGDGYWSAELRLPAAGDNAEEINSLVGIAGHTPSLTYPWYLNILRQNINNGTTELSALNPTGGKFHTPEKMAKVYRK